MNGPIFDQIQMNSNFIILMYRGTIVEFYQRPIANEQEFLLMALNKALVTDFKFEKDTHSVKPDIRE